MFENANQNPACNQSKYYQPQPEANDPFGQSTQAMFDGFEKVSEASKKTGEQKPAGQSEPEMDEKEMKQFEQ